MEVEGCPQTQTPERETHPKVVHVVRLKTEFEEAVNRNLELEFVEGYNKDELLFWSKEAAKCVSEAHKFLEGLA